MLNRLRPQVAWLIGALLLGLLLTACGGASQSTPPQEAAAPAQTDEAVATSANDQEVEKTQEAAATTETATEEATAEVAAATSEAEATPGENPAVSTSPQAICHPADPNNDQLAAMIQTVVEAPENELIAAVSGNDWSKGPANAPVTLIEYGDFQ